MIDESIHIHIDFENIPIVDSNFLYILFGDISPGLGMIKKIIFMIDMKFILLCK